MSDFANQMNIIEVIDILVRGFRIAMILFSPLKLGLVKSCEILNLIGTFIRQYDALITMVVAPEPLGTM